MAQLDSFFEYMKKYKGTELCLESNVEPRITISGKIRTMAKQQLSYTRILSMLKEVVTPEMMEELQEEDRVEFVYASSACSVRGIVTLEDEMVRVIFTPHGREEPAEGGPEEKGLEEPKETKQKEAKKGKPKGTEDEKKPKKKEIEEEPAAEALIIPEVEVEKGRPAIERFFKILHFHKGSDLHISAGEKPSLRKNGKLLRLDDLEEIEAHEAENLMVEFIPEENGEELEQSHDTTFSYEIKGVGWVRCNIFKTKQGLGGCFRLIPAEIMSAEVIGISDIALRLCTLPKGLILISGPAGSGKSTTLNALVDYMNEQRFGHIITIEDPIEFVHRHKKCLIHQRMIGVHAESFSRGLKAARREDPDIIVVGELRDQATISLVLESAEAGCLVLGTCHTPTVVSTIDRLVGQFPADRHHQVRGMLADTLKGILAQTLCAASAGGQAAALEVLIVTAAVASLIKEGKTFQIQSVMQANKALGMTTLNDSLIKLVSENLVDPHEAYSKAVDKEGFVTLLRKGKHDVGFLKELEAIRGL